MNLTPRLKKQFDFKENVTVENSTVFKKIVTLQDSKKILRSSQKKLYKEQRRQHTLDDVTESDIQRAEPMDGTSNVRDMSKDRPIRFIVIISVSVILCVFFLFSSTVQTNDLNGTQWLVFYAFH
jgi:hypothetical protein